MTDAVTQAREAVEVRIKEHLALEYTSHETYARHRMRFEEAFTQDMALADAYAAALLAAERQRVVGMVEALKYDTRVEGYNGFEASVWNGALSTVAARLTGGE